MAQIHLKSAQSLVFVNYICNNNIRSPRKKRPTSAYLQVRLFKGPKDYPTTFLKEIHLDLSGDLNLDSLPTLFDLDTQFEV